MNGEGVDDIAAAVTDHLQHLAASGALRRRRTARARDEITALAIARLRARMGDLGSGGLLERLVRVADGTPEGVEGTDFVAITNHFKSKGGSGATGDNVDSGDGQGAYNADRVGQAEALVAFAERMKAETGTDRVLLMGDFNAYEKEDPIRVLEAAGYLSQGALTGGCPRSSRAGGRPPWRR